MTCMPTTDPTRPKVFPGQTLQNPVTGERFTFTHTAQSTGAELLAFDLELHPGGAVPIVHVHPIQSERFEVLEGEMRFRLGLRRRMAGSGDVVQVDPGVPHSFANPGDEPARVHVEDRPALRMGEMFADVIAMAEDGRMTRRGLPRNQLELAPLELAPLAPLTFSARHPRASLAVAAVTGVGVIA